MMNQKNYTGQNADIKNLRPKFLGAAAHTRLVENPHIDASKIEIDDDPDERILTLKGVVDNDAQRMLAISLARTTPGVLTVQDRIAIQ